MATLQVGVNQLTRNATEGSHKVEGRNALRHGSVWWSLAGGSVALVAALAGRAQIDPWLFGALLLIAWGLLAYAGTRLAVTMPLRLLVTATAFVLVVVVWNYTAPQPHVRLDAVSLRSLPSTVTPGLVELTVRNTGSVPAHVAAFRVAYLAPLFRTPRALAAGSVEGELSARLNRADRLPPTGTFVVPAGQTVHVSIDIPSSERAWYLGRGETTVLVAARLHYRDRVFRREKVFCHFANPPSGRWLPCPFLNN